MDNQQNNQNQSNQIPTNQEPPIPETQLPPIPETPAQPTPEIATEPILETSTIEETEDKDDDEKLTQQQSEAQPTPEIATEPIPETSATEEIGDEDNDEEFSQQPEVQSEPEIPETPQPEPILETQSESVDVAAAKYQQILDEYAASNKPSESEMQTTETPEPEQISSETELPSQPEANFEPEQLPPEPEIESEPNLPPISGSQYQTPVESIPNNQFIEDAPQANLFKLLFIISLFINIIVFSFAGLVYYKTTQNEDASNLPQITPEQESSITCSRDGKEYKVGEYFTHADGCNTCSCSEVGEIVCTEKACDITPATQSATKTTITPTKAATKSAIPKITPDKIVLTFYQGYIKSSQGINAYKNSPYLTQSFQDKLAKDYSSSTGPEVDAILLAQDKPKIFTSKIIKQNDTTATVSLTESNGWSQTLTVNLVIVDDQWKIDSVTLND